MISKGSLGAIDALIRTVAMGEPCAELTAAEIPVVCTVSTAAGAGGREVAKRLAERLNVGFFDKRILQRVAKETHTEPEILKRLDECVEGMRGAWLRSLLTGEDLSKETFRRNLINVILGIGCKGGVILGRGGNFILAHRPVLRVRIVGSPSFCVRRIVEEQGIDPSAAKLVQRRTDEDRRAFVHTLYGRDIGDPLGYDLVLNSDRLALEVPAEIAALALQRLRANVLKKADE
jgi:cytidylate kinase